MQKDDSIRLQSELFGDVCPQSSYSFTPGDSKLHRAAGGRGYGQAYGRLTRDLRPASCGTAQGEATEASLLLHSDFGRWVKIIIFSLGLYSSVNDVKHIFYYYFIKIPKTGAV